MDKYHVAAFAFFMGGIVGRLCSDLNEWARRRQEIKQRIQFAEGYCACRRRVSGDME